MHRHLTSDHHGLRCSYSLTGHMSASPQLPVMQLPSTQKAQTPGWRIQRHSYNTDCYSPITVGSWAITVVAVPCSTSRSVHLSNSSFRHYHNLKLPQDSVPSAPDPAAQAAYACRAQLPAVLSTTNPHRATQFLMAMKPVTLSHQATNCTQSA